MIEFTPSSEQQMLIDSVHRFAESEIRPVAHRADEDAGAPQETIEKGWQLGIVPSLIPEEYGGYAGGESAVTAVLALEELGWGDVSIAINILSPATFALAIQHAGTASQKRNYLSKFCDQSRPRMTAALMEPSITFDPHEPATVAQDLDGNILITGEKFYVPGADSAEEIIVYAKSLHNNSVNGYIVQKLTKGMNVGETSKLMGLRSLPTFRIMFDAVNIHAESRVGEGDSSGFHTILNRSRIALAALAVGQSRAAFEYARDYAKSRNQFGVPIATKQAIAFKLADMAVEVDAARLMVWDAAWQADQGMELTATAAILKHHVAKMALFVADSAVQILGGHGYIREHPVERWLRNARGFATFEGLTLI